MFLTEADLNTIKGLLHYLNQGQLRNGDLRLDDISVLGSDGDVIARVGYRNGEYGVVAA